MSPHPSDAWIDDELKNVAVPGLVLQKLAAIASFNDTELDRALCDVAPSAGLLERLRSIGSLDESDLDDELRHIGLPVSLAERLRQIPRTMQRGVLSGVFVRRLAIAASLLIAMGVGYLAVMAPSFFGRQQQQTADAGNGAAKNAQGNQTKKNGGSTSPATATGNNGNVELAKSQADNGDLPPEQPLTPGDDRATDQVADDRDNTAQGPDNPQNITNTLPLDNALGASVASDRLPPLESLPSPVWRGVTPPRDIGYDWMLQLRYGVHPFVSPARPALVECPVPLVTSTESFDEALRFTAAGRLPSPQKIRTEEFLAAMDYGFSPPEGSALAVRTAVGPSPWVATGSSLLQVGAQAKVLSRDPNSGSHIVAIVDASATMGWERRWQNVLGGLKQYAERMHPADRLTLILMGEKPEIIAERKASAEVIDALGALANQPSAKMVSAVDALRVAIEAADRGLSDGPARIVLLTDGGLGLGQPAFEQIESLARDFLRNDAQLEIVDVRQEDTLDAELDRLVAALEAGRSGDRGAATHIAVTHLAAAGDLRWRLLELATGKSQLVATQATMKVKFKPDAVALYRLIGHEATSMATTVAALNSDTVAVDLRSGEAAAGLFEIFLKPDGGDTIATVELTWKDPKTGAVQKTQQNVTRLQFAPSFHQAPLSLQMAALAAETAEILRNSHFTPPNSHSLSHVAEVGALLNARLRNRPSFERLMTLIRQAGRSL